MGFRMCLQRIQDNALMCLKCGIMIDKKNIDDKDFKLFLEEKEKEWTLMDTLCQNLVTWYYYQGLVTWS